MFSNNEPSEGRAFVYLGGPNGPRSDLQPWTAEPNVNGAWFGYSVASAGDVDGDGYDDVVVGAPLDDTGGDGAGRAFVYLGSQNGVRPQWLWQTSGATPGSLLGGSVACAGDVNADGYSDVIAGANGYNSYTGYIMTLMGGPGTPGHTFPVGFGLITAGAQNGEGLGISVAGAGDVNGDGYSDVIAASVNYSSPTHPSVGQASLFYGNGGDTQASGLPVLPQARRMNSTTPIVPGNKTVSASGFDASLLQSRGPMGRSRVKIQVEAKPLGTPFDGSNLLTSAWVDSQLAGATLKQTVGPTVAGATPHWRARLIYDPSRGPWFQRSHWIYGGLSGHPRGVHARIAP